MVTTNFDQLGHTPPVKTAEATSDTTIVAEQLIQALESQFDTKISKETAQFITDHLYSGLTWIFKKAHRSAETVALLVEDFGPTLAALLDGGEGQIFLINPALFKQIESIYQEAAHSSYALEELQITLESEFPEIPIIECTLADYLESIGIEEGVHWIQGLVSAGETIQGFEKMEEPTRLPVEAGQTDTDVLKKVSQKKGNLEAQTKPHEINAKYWINEHFKEKYLGKSPWENFYLALKRLADKNQRKKRSFNLRDVFGFVKK